RNSPRGDDAFGTRAGTRFERCISGFNAGGVAKGFSRRNSGDLSRQSNGGRTRHGGELGRTRWSWRTCIGFLSESYADRLAVEVGDELEFNVQGLPVAATVSSIRKVDWNRFQSNFRVVFAEGTIDQAPQFYLMMANLPNPEDAARFQTDVVEAFPNVSV